MAEQIRHISIQRMARLERNPSDPDREELERHLAGCDACRAVYEEVRRGIARMPVPEHPPAFFPALDAAPCPRAEEMASYARLKPAEKLPLWAHVVFGHCEDCAAAARAAGLALDLRRDPVTQALVERFGAKAPRRQTPEFLFAMAGESDGAPRTEVMNIVVMLSDRPKQAYPARVTRTRLDGPGGFWRVRVQFEKGVRLPRGFSMSVYLGGSPEKPLRTSYTGELEVDLPEDSEHDYILNIDNQDYVPIPFPES